MGMPNRDRKRSGAGEFVEEIGLDDVVDVFDEVRGPAVITSSDVAGALGCTTEAARQKLKRLYDRGEVDRRKSGRTTLWWHTGGERIPDDVRARGVADAGAAGDESEPTATPAADTVTSDAGDIRARGDTLADALDALDTTDERRAAVRACVAYLREHGSGQRSDFLDAVYPEHGAGFRSEGGWWNKIGKEYLKAVAGRYDPVRAPEKEGSHTWRWVGGEP